VLFDIFDSGSSNAITRRADLRDRRRRQHEHLAEHVVEPLRDVAGKLDVLLLILADRDVRRVVKEDVGRLEDRVGQEPRS
jgi:hypothetical protein